TTTLISFSSEPSYRDDFGPFTPGFVIVPYNDIQALKQAITPNTAAVMLEPIQGEGGVIIPRSGYLRQVADICRQQNVLFIADEIQTGLGRTGKVFASDHEGVRPDVVIVGKALSGGFYPISAVLADEPILGLFQPGEHGSTFGGNPLAAAIGRAALRVIVEEKLVANAAEQGEYLLEQLAEIPSRHVKEVRGKGLLIGVELKPEAGGARRFCEALKDRGILAKETHQHVIRFAPPLIIQRETVDEALEKIRTVLTMS
ncbi:MAG TPA: aminotransferase class III-fold pyridoxal phosphate-dependent enzyme, partial [Anaerolinea sp.]|nr:aminotransferase class III-fold pyridoxal phosphate-dependent enzyme [Anaerolinea sp.]